MADMGDLRLRTVLNTGLRIEPPLDARIAEYRKFLSEGGMIISTVKTIVGIKGRGLAMVTALPEVLDKKCQRMGVKYKRGDVTVVVDMLKNVSDADRAQSTRPAGTADYIRNNGGKLLQRTVLLSNIVLPVISSNVNRESIVPSVVLSQSERVEGLDVFCILTSDIEKLIERENELFNIAEPSH